ncbi:MAG: HAD family hydrolase [Pyrinomonadaceae bacterium]
MDYRNQPTASPASELRILLWDIDGTLIRSRRIGAYKDYTIPVLQEIFGTAGQLEQMRVSGMTDFQIVAEALREEGLTHHHIREQMQELKLRLTDEMRKVTAQGEPFFEVLPGVREVLDALKTNDRYRSALVTGNLEPTAYLKMELVGLRDYFDLPGAFGDESHNRNDLPALAADRIRKHLNIALEPNQFIVIGDTPNDIACARHFGARSMAVNTGRFYTREQILKCGPDALLPDLTNASLVIQTLDTL